jgi:hypothetical protein
VRRRDRGEVRQAVRAAATTADVGVDVGVVTAADGSVVVEKARDARAVVERAAAVAAVAVAAAEEAAAPVPRTSSTPGSRTYHSAGRDSTACTKSRTLNRRPVLARQSIARFPC